MEITGVNEELEFDVCNSSPWPTPVMAAKSYRHILSQHAPQIT